MKTILATTSSFDESGELSILLNQQDFTLVRNPLKRKLTPEELVKYLGVIKPIGLLAGLETLSEDVFRATESYLKVVSRVGVGIENVDVNAAQKYGIRVFNTADSVSPAVAELTVGLIFDLARRISFHDRLVRRGTWEKHTGVLIEGKTLGLVGFGRIGQRVGRMMRSLGAKVIGYDPLAKDEWFKDNQVSRSYSIDELCADSDVISVHVPLTDESRHLISVAQFKLMKQGAFLVNTSRGGIVDESALLAALTSGALSGAALDVFEQEPYSGALIQLDNVVVTPHIGSYAKEARAKMEREAVANLISQFGGAI